MALLAVLGINVLFVILLMFNMVLRKHREQTTWGTTDIRSFFAGRAALELFRRRMADGTVNATWNPAAGTNTFAVTLEDGTVATVTWTDTGF